MARRGRALLVGMVVLLCWSPDGNAPGDQPKTAS
jgi:hypothetical protein